MQADYDDADLVLIDQLAAGDPDALEALYARHGSHLLRYLTYQLGDRDSAEEALQNMLLAMWTAAARFRKLSRVRTWMFSIARRQASKVRRRTRPDSLPLEEALLGGDDPADTLKTHCQLNDCKPQSKRSLSLNARLWNSSTIGA